MKTIIATNDELCVGCNRCVKECPVEMANIIYQDERENIKVKVDNEKCISCGKCISVCKSKARYYEDDIELFFDDLSKGVPISMISAPAIRTNVPNWKNLFTYLKKKGVRKIYDVSLGADICIWAHIRYIEKNINNLKPIITQPCPSIVSYCEKYQHGLLKNLSPIHSPMACTAVYMKRYEGINDKIAALSPCIAKSDEFNSIKTIHYNVTFAKLHEYIKENNIQLPKEETEFDHYKSGLGSLFSMPGGLKENIEFFTGKSFRIDKSEGDNVYKNLDEFAKMPLKYLPQIYDVLNCAEGCNIGSGCLHNRSIFEVDTIMEDCRQKATENRKLEYFDLLFQKYDEAFKLSYFIREYRPAHMPIRQINDSDINKAFEALGKNDYAKQNFDCGACGSDSCYSMARKIALKTNIPINCVIKSRDEAKEEHKKNIKAYEENIKYTKLISDSFSEIKHSAIEITKNTKNLNDNVLEYSKMAKSIGEIASMINIISINASIEAARAGVHGKAFSVIASEIQMLAVKSKGSVSTAESLHELSETSAKLVSDNVGTIQNIIVEASIKSVV